jgi:hypothetical protein
MRHPLPYTSRRRRRQRSEKGKRFRTRPVRSADPFVRQGLALQELENRNLLSMPGELASSYGQLPLSFEPNVGQAATQTQFLARGSGYSLSLSSGDAILDLQGSSGQSATSATTLSMQLVGAATTSSGVGLEPLGGKTNYYLPNRQYTDIPNYGRVEYDNVYPGIDVGYYGNQGELEYDFTVAPGANPNAIALALKGADQVHLDAQGNLVVQTTSGQVVEHAPIVYQDIQGVHHVVAGSYRVSTPPRNTSDNYQISFQIGPYDTSQPLIIDPILDYSTSLGPTSVLNANSRVSVDSDGNVYVTTDDVIVAGVQDATIVTKIDPTGTKALYTTVIGGPTPDVGNPGTATPVDIASDAKGNAYLALGLTTASIFPSVVTNEMLDKDASSMDGAFVVRLDANGQLVYATPLGGSLAPQNVGVIPGGFFPQAIAAAADGTVYLAASTEFQKLDTFSSLDGVDAFQSAPRTPAFVPTGFVVELDPFGGPVFATYLGGSGGPKPAAPTPDTRADTPVGIGVDDGGFVYVAGNTTSPDFPLMNAFQSAFPGTKLNLPNGGFVTELDPTGARLVYSTFLGGSSAQVINGLAVDGGGNAYVTGLTNSTDFPVSADALFASYPSKNAATQQLGGNGFTAFATKFDPVGKLVYSTFLGGDGVDQGNAIAADSEGNAYLTGETTSDNFPTIAAFQGQRSAQSQSDAFVTELSSDGSTLVYSSYLGGGGPSVFGVGQATNSGTGIGVDANGEAFVTGQTESGNFPTVGTPPAGAITHGPYFLAKISGSGSLLIHPVPIQASLNQPFTKVVATFTTTDATLTASDFTAIVDWGDGSVANAPSSELTITPAPGKPGFHEFQITGTHEYTTKGTFPLAIEVDDTRDDLVATTDTNVTRLRGNQIDPTIAADPTTPGSLFLASADETSVTAAENQTGGGLFAAYSTDFGASWIPSDTTNRRIADGADGDGDDGLPLALGLPNAVFDQFGNLFLTYVAADGTSAVVATSKDGGQTFTELTSFPLAEGSAPKLAVGPGTSAKTGSVWIVLGGGLTGNLTVAGAQVTGLGNVGAFTAPIPVPDSDAAVLSDIAVGPAGQVLVSWEDQTGSDRRGKLVINLNPAGLLNPSGFAPSATTVSDTPALPDFPTPLPADTAGITADPSILWDLSGKSGSTGGQVYLVYTALDPQGGGSTDIVTQSSTDEGQDWSTPVIVNDTDTNSRFLPSIDVDPSTGDVAVGWLDARNDPNNQATQFFVAVSADGGKTFSSNTPESGSSNATAGLNSFGQEFQYGDYSGLAFASQRVLPAWPDNSSRLDNNLDLPQFDIGMGQVAEARVVVPPPELTAVALSKLTEGGTFQDEIATFTDADPTLNAGDFTVFINWGDGTPLDSTSGEVVPGGAPGLPFHIVAEHTFAEAGVFPVVIEVQDDVNDVVATTDTDISALAGDQFQPSITANPINPNQMFAAGVDAARPGLFAASSQNGGLTWTPTDVTDQLASAGGEEALPNETPHAVDAFDQFGNLFLAYVAADGETIVVAVSTDGGQNFTVVTHFTETTPVADPVLATGPGSNGNGGSLWLSYLRDFNFDAGTLVIEAADVTGLGQVGLFSAPVLLPNSTNSSQGGIAIGPSGQALVAWDSQVSQAGNIFVSLNPDGLNNPNHFLTPVLVAGTDVAGFQSVLPQSKEGISPLPQVAWDRSGGTFNNRVYLVFTDADKIDDPDTYLAEFYSDNQGATWTGPVEVDDSNGKATLFNPSLAVDQSTGAVGVAWYDTRNDPDDTETQFFAAISSDGGQSFNSNEQVSLDFSDATADNLDSNAQKFQYGDYTSLAFAGGFFYPAWSDNSRGLADNPDIPPDPDSPAAAFDIADARIALAVVADAPLTSSGGATIAATKLQPANRTVATFTDADPNAKASNYTAQINWGDKSTSQGAIVANSSGGFKVAGTHTYQQEGNFAISVTIVDYGGASTTATATAVVTDPPPQVAANQPSNNAVPGIATGNVTVANFTIPGGPETGTGEYTATINWGDGTSDNSAAITVAAGIVSVSESHTFLTPGTDQVSVTLTDDNGGSATAVSTVNVVSSEGNNVSVIGLGGPGRADPEFFDSGFISNNTGADITGPLFLVVHGLPTGVTLANANGTTAAGDPYITMNITRLLHGQTVPTPLFEFSNPQTIPFDYSVTTFDPPGPASAPNAGPAGASTSDRSFGTIPLSFEPNQGQTNPAVKFLSQGNGYSLFLTANQAVLALNQGSGSSGNALTMPLIGANPSPQVTGVDPLPGADNYLIGNSPSHWQTNVPTYGAVEFQNIYPGVTLDYHGNQQQLEYDFIVAANADPGVIKLGIQRATSVALDARGNLLLHTSGGDVVEQAPVIYQLIDGQRRLVTGDYVLLPNQQVGFHVGPYDHSQPLIIDPVLEYSTYLGGSKFDLGNAIAVDSAGNVYVVGTTASPDFPAVNALQETFNSLIQQLGTGVAGAADAKDAFVTKLDPTGQVVYSTFFGGSQVLGFGAATNSASGVAVDSAGDVYFTGSTDATDLPTVNAFQSTLTPLSIAPFVAKLDPTGSTLLYSTYLGGSINTQPTEATGIAVDGAGEAYVTGFAAPGGIPTSNALQPNNLSQKTVGGTNAFITKLNSAGSSLIYSTYLGGSTSDTATAIAVDSSGNAYVTGETQSLDFPTTSGSFQPKFTTSTAFASTNAASSWSNTGLTVPTALIVPDPVNASTLYAATTEGVTLPTAGLLKSTDGGATWAFINQGLVDFQNITALAIDPTNDATLYAGTQQGVVNKSTDGGQTWSNSSGGLTGGGISALVIDPNTPTTIYAATSVGVFKSTDGGNSWTASPDSGLVVPAGQSNAGQALTVTSLVIDPTNPQTLYGDNAFGVYKSTDGGNTWTFSAASPASVTAISLAKATPTTLYVGTQTSGVFKSADGGSTWDSVSAGLPSQTVSGGTAFGNVRALVVDPTNANTVYIAMDNLSSAHAGGGVFKSTDGGNTWQAINTGLPGSIVTTLAVDPVAPSTLYVGRSELDADAFVAKIKPDGSALVYSTFLGGTRWNVGTGIAVDAAGNAYITGSTASTDFPTVNPLQPANKAAVPGEIDVAPQTFFAPGVVPTHTINPESTTTNAFLAKLSPDGSKMVYGTYLGGSGNDSANAVAVDPAGNAYVVGGTTSTDFPTDNALQPQSAGGEDAFVARINAAGTALDYSTYLGGSGDDSASGVAVDAQGNAYIVGTTLSDDLRTVNAQQPVQDGNGNAFIAKIAPQGPGVLQLTSVPIQATEGAAFSGPVADFTDTDTDTVANFSATIDWGDGQTTAGTISTTASGSFVVSGTHTYTEDGTFPIFVTVGDTDGATATAQSTAVNTPAGTADYHITVDTSALSGTSGELDLQFNPGALPDAQSATVSISNFNATGGTLLGSPTIAGGASGTLSGTLQLNNSSMLNEATFPLTFGAQLSFDVQISGDAIAHPNAAGVFGSTFALSLLGADGRTPEATSDASGALLDLGVFPDGTSSVQTFAPGAGAAPIARAAAANMIVVADAPLTAVTTAIHPIEGIPFTSTVATFTDANPSGTVSDFTATIDWGDGSPPSPGTVTSNGPGRFSVAGSHTYATAGTDTLKITIADRGGSTTVAAPAKVSRLEAPLRQELGDFNPAQGDRELAVGDLTGNGKLDLVLAGVLTSGSTSETGVDVLLGNGDGTFQAPVFVQTPAGITSVAIADLTGNGKQDIIVTDSDGVSILLGNGDGTFQPPTNVSTGGLVASDVAVGDFTGSGKLDLAVANFLNSPNGTASNQVSILLGNGDGTFQPPVMVQTDSGPDVIVSGDFTGNGKIDLATLNVIGQDISVLLGNGDGTFQPAVNYPIAVTAGADNLAAVDLTGNGKLDLVTLGSVLMNKGDGTFLAAQSFPTEPGATSLAVGDFNGDGKPDLVVAGGGNDLSVYLGKGDGTFQSSTNLPEVAYGALIAGDFDNDGKLDLAAIPQSVGLGAASVDVLLGNGDGTFPSIPTYSTGPAPQSVLVGNFHGGKVPDLVTLADGELTLARGRGDGTFVAAANYPAQTPEAIAEGDFTNNGRTDLITANGTANSISLFLANADGTYQPPRTVAVAGGPNAIAVGDFDGDGKLDVAVTTQNGVSVLLGNGDGTFQPAKTFAAGQDPLAIAAGDFQNNGKLDLAVADADGHVSVLLGNGDGTFQPAATFAVGDVDTTAIAVADFNGDGKLDIVTANQGQGTGSPGVSILFGNGDGTFQPAVNIPLGLTTASGFPLGPEGLAVGDFAGNGKPDLALTVPGKGVVVLLNKGNGNFQTGTTIPIPGSLSPIGETITAGDATGNGKVDLFVISATTSGLVSVLLGNGDGTFQPPVNYVVGQTTSAGPTGIIVGNLTSDGHLDFATANFLDNTISVVKGNGDGTFQAALALDAGHDDEFVAEGDFTGTGKLDLVTSTITFAPNNEVLRIFLGNGDGTFQPPETLTVNPNNTSLGAPVLGDFTGNGKLDIAVPVNFQNEVAVFLGNGDGTFQQPIITTGSFGAIDLAVGDFDRDGKLDLVGLVTPVGSQPEEVVFFAGNGDGTFKAPVEFPTGIQSANIGPFANLLGVGDFRGDGQLDVAVVSPGATVVGASPPPSGIGSDILSVLLGNGDGTFQPATTTPLGQFGVAALAVADLKNNGKLDLITANSQAGDVSVLFGNGDGTFAAPVNFPAGVQPSAVAVGDFDGDGSPDLAVADARAGDVSVLLGSVTPVVTTVTDAPLTASGTTLQATAGTAFTSVVATFTDANPDADLTQYAVPTIDWGDGQSSAGTISQGSSGTFDVTGTHTYADAGTFTASVTVNDVGGNAATARTMATVAPAVPTISVVPVSVTYDGQPHGTTAEVFGVGNVDLGKATVSFAGGVVPIHAGTYSVTAAFPGNSQYAATSVTVANAVTISLATPIVSANNDSSTFTGAALTYPTSDVSVRGVNGLTASGGTLSFTYNGSSTVPTKAGTYTVVATFTPTNVTDYTTTTGMATWSINPATLTVTADSKTKVYGTANLPLTDTIRGFVNGDTSSVVSGSAGLSTTATTASGIGNYAITVGPGTLSAVNYTFDFVNAKLSVTPSTLTVTADNKTMVSGTSVPALTDTISGFVNGDTASVVSGAADLATTATTESPAGSFPITVGPGTLSADNYTFAFANGTLTVTPAGSGSGEGGISGTAVPVVGYEFGAPSMVAVATFSDGDGSLPTGDFSATIDWGDGTTSAGSVSLSSASSGGSTPQFVVSGSHTYHDEGHFNVQVTIQQTAGTSTGATSTTVSAAATIHEQLLADGTAGTPDQNYIQEIYRDLFARQAETQGLDYWVAELTQGVPRQQVAFQMVKIASFEEFQHDTVAALYEQYLGRVPDAGGLAYWSAYLYDGGTIEGMSQALVSSPEYWQTRAGGTADGFLTALFHDALGRAIEPAALSYFTGLMAKGASVADMAASVFNSDEYHRLRVNALFEQFLDRPADPGALAYFADELDNSGTDELVIAQLLASDEYFGKGRV